MRVLIVSQYFWPEPFKISELATELANSNLDVTVVTSIPNYPDGAVYEQYEADPSNFDQLDQVEIFRVWQCPRGKTKLQLLFNYVSFLLFASVKLIKLWFQGHRYDVVVSAQLSPITSVIPAILYAKIVNTQLIYWVFDLWPDSVITKQGLSAVVYGPARLICSVIYRQANLLCVTSMGFGERLMEMGVKKESIYYLPQWPQRFESISSKRTKHVDEIFHNTNDKIKVLFTGNIGTAQNLIEVVEAINMSEVRSKYKFVFVGNGRMFEKMKRLCADYQLENTITFTGRLPPEDLPAIYAKADFLLLSLMSNPVFDLTLPAKLQAYMMAGKPIMVMAGGEAKLMIESAKCGYASSTNDRYGYMELLKLCATVDRREMKLSGERASDYAEKNFRKETLVEKFIEKIKSEI